MRDETFVAGWNSGFNGLKQGKAAEPAALQYDRAGTQWRGFVANFVASFVANYIDEVRAKGL